jgi:type I restriction enzyme M protein
MIDASGGFLKDGNKNRLRAWFARFLGDIHKIGDAFNKRLETPKYSRKVSGNHLQRRGDVVGELST